MEIFKMRALVFGETWGGRSLLMGFSFAVVLTMPMACFALAADDSAALRDAAVAMKEATQVIKETNTHSVWKDAIGPLAGGVVGLISSLATYWWKDLQEKKKAPKLEVNIADGTLVDINSPSGNRHIRLRIRNSGERVAKRCRVMVAGIIRLKGGKWVKVGYEDAIELVWAYGWEDVDKNQEKDLVKSIDNYYVDLCHVGMADNKLVLDLARKSMHREILSKHNGPYIITIQAIADDAVPVIKSFQLNWGGQWDSLQIQPPPMPVPTAT